MRRVQRKFQGLGVAESTRTAERELRAESACVIVAAGMENALPSVVGVLVIRPESRYHTIG